jgi:hypothetical protein
LDVIDNDAQGYILCVVPQLVVVTIVSFGCFALLWYVDENENDIGEAVWTRISTYQCYRREEGSILDSPDTTAKSTSAITV